jgi:hypothetical protein
MDCGTHFRPALDPGALAGVPVNVNGKEVFLMDLSSILDLQGTEVVVENVDLPASFDSSTC